MFNFCEKSNLRAANVPLRGNCPFASLGAGVGGTRSADISFIPCPPSLTERRRIPKLCLDLAATFLRNPSISFRIKLRPYKPVGAKPWFAGYQSNHSVCDRNCFFPPDYNIPITVENCKFSGIFFCCSSVNAAVDLCKVKECAEPSGGQLLPE